MPNLEIEMNPVEFITVGTVGPKGQRVFHLQAGKEGTIVSLTIEKEQAWALSEAIREMIDDLDKRFPAARRPQPTLNMDLREPIEPLFRVAQMGLGYDEDRDLIVLVAQELVSRLRFTPGEEAEDEDDETFTAEAFTEAADDDDLDNAPGIVRLWSTRDQMRALSEHSSHIVKSGRPDPRQNGRLVYYWT